MAHRPPPPRQPVPDEVELEPPLPQLPSQRRLVLLILLLLAVVVAGVWYAQQRALDYGCRHLAELTHQPLHCVNARGALPGTLQADLIRYSTPTMVVELRHVQIKPLISWLLAGRLVLSDVRTRDLNIYLLKSTGKPLHLPNSLGLPRPVRIRALTIDHLAYYAPGGAAPIQIDDIQGQATLNQREWNVEQAQLTWHGLRIAGFAQMQAQRPFPVTADLTVSGPVHGHPLQARVLGAGPLDRAVVLTGTGTVDKTPVTARASLTLTGHHVIADVSARAPGVPVHTWIKGLPQLDADLEARAEPTNTGWHGTLSVKNQGAGPLDKHRLPATRASTAWAWDSHAHQLALSDLQLQLPDGGLLAGRLTWNGALDIDARGSRIDLARFWSTLHSTRLDGPFSVKTRDYHLYQITGDLRQGNDRLQLAGRVDSHQAAVDTLSWQRGTARVAAKGKLEFAGKRAFATELQLERVNPAALGQFPAGLVNGTVEARGELLPHPDVRWQARIRDSQLQGTALAVEGSGRYRPNYVEMQQTRVQYDGIGLRLNGSLGTGSSGLQLGGSFAGRPQWYPDLSGSATLEATLTGPLLTPALRGQITSTGLAWRDWSSGPLQLAIDSGSDLFSAISNRALPALQLQVRAQDIRRDGTALALVQGSVGLAGNSGAMHIGLQARGVTVGQRHVDEATLQLDGPLTAHAVRLEWLMPEQRVAVAAQGALDLQALTWQGRLSRLEGTGRLPFALTGPAQLMLSSEQVLVNNLNLTSSKGGAFSLRHITWQPQRWSTEGRFEHLPLREVLAVTGRQPPPLDVMLGGEWNLAFAETLTGHVRVLRESGDVKPIEELGGLGLERGVLEIEAEQNQINGRLDINSRAMGRIRGQLATRLEQRDGRLGLAGSAPLKGQLLLDVPSLDWLGQWFTTPGYRFAGTVRANVDLSGTVAAPVWQGRLTARQLAARAAAYGVDWKNGELDAAIEQDRLVVERLTLQGGDGRLDGKGLLSLRDNDPDISVDLTATRLTVLGRPDQKLVVSGTGRAMLRDQRLALTADLQVNRGLVTLKSSQDSALDDDIIVRRTPGSAPAEQKKIGLWVSARVDLGEDFEVRHRSFNAEATGVLRLESSPQRPATLTGNVAVDKGTLYTYGQKLRLDPGSTLNFNGPPDNPAFNLKAYRDNLPLNQKTGEATQVGVNLTGTARRPLLRLISTPEMTDREKLSWLVFGQDLASNNKGNNQVSVLSTAASALFSEIGDGGPGILNQTVGIDDVSVEQNAADVSRGVVRLGKQLIPNLYISYGKGYNGAHDELQLNYLFNQKWSVEVKSAEATAVDVFYTISFD